MHLAQVVQDLQHVSIDLYGLACADLGVKTGLGWALTVKYMGPPGVEDLHELVLKPHHVRL